MTATMDFGGILATYIRPPTAATAFLAWIVVDLQEAGTPLLDGTEASRARSSE